MKLCSACLLGEKCRFDGESKPVEKVLELAQKETLIPVCPEQLGGLPTPRTASEQVNDKVMTIDGRDVTNEYNKGAEAKLKIARDNNIDNAILKQRSPSCGCGQIYDGTFSGKIIDGNGTTTKLLKKNGIKVISEEDL